MTEATKILYVDDEPDIRLIVEMSLKMKPGIDVRTASSGQEALNILIGEGWAPDLLMIDVMMPGMTGPEVLSKLRAEAATATIPVVFVTARARRQDIDGYIAQGAKGVVTKPFDPIGLRDEVLGILAA